MTVRLEHARGATRPGRTRPSGPRPRRDRRTRAVVAGAVALLVVLVGGVVLLRALRSDPERVRVGAPAGPATTAAPSTTVDPNLVDLPNVVGKSVTEGQSLLGAAGFFSNATSVASAQPSGTVITQDPTGSRAPRGSVVTLGVSTGS